MVCWIKRVRCWLQCSNTQRQIETIFLTYCSSLFEQLRSGMQQKRIKQLTTNYRKWIKTQLRTQWSLVAWNWIGQPWSLNRILILGSIRYTLLGYEKEWSASETAFWNSSLKILSVRITSWKFSQITSHLQRLFLADERYLPSESPNQDHKSYHVQKFHSGFLPAQMCRTEKVDWKGERW